MTNKERFMKYARKRLKEKEYKRRKLLVDLADVQYRGFVRCSRYKLKRGQP